MHKLWTLFLVFSSMSFSQNLEEQIYVATEAFIENPNNVSYKTIHQQEAKFKSLVKTQDEQLALVFLQCHKGYFLDQNSRLEAAILTYENALKRFKNHQLSKISNFDIVESCLIPLGNLYTKTGNYTNAENIIKQYIVLAEAKKNNTQKVSGIINLAQLYYTISKYEAAIKLTSDYLKHDKLQTNQKQKLISINANSKIASGQIERNDEIPIRLDDDEKKYKIALKNQNYIAALNAFNALKAKRLSNKQLSKRDLAKHLVEEAQLYVLLKQNTKVLNSLNSALKILIPDFQTGNVPKTEDVYAENTFIDIFDLYAEIQSSPINALKYYDLSIYVSNLLRNTWTSQESKHLNQTNHKIRSEKCIDLLYQLYQNTRNKTYIFKALEYSENSRASTLKEIFQKKLYLQKHPNDSLLIKEYNLLRQQEHHTGLLIKEQLGKNRVSKINSLNKKLIEISLQLNTIKQLTLKKHIDYKSYVSIEDVQKKLVEDQSLLVEYFYGKHTIYQFVVSPEDILINSINITSKIQNHIVDYIHFFDNASKINNAIPKFTESAFNLFKLLKLDTIPSEQNVILIPDGILNFVPFETLLTQPTQTISFSKMPFLIKQKRIVYNSSMFFYATDIQTVTNNDLLGFFPVFEGTDRALNYSINEAKAISNTIPSTVLMHKHATKSSFLTKAAKYGIVHISTHASSGSSITPASIDFYDDTLYINELYSMDFSSNLVVLSACETGIGKLLKGEGAMSIARGFQYAGAKNVLFSLWQINDLATSKLMTSFYKNYSENQSAHTSNQQSKLDYLKDKDISNAKKSPYYWGAFLYYGEIVPKNTSIHTPYIVLGIISILIIVPLLFKFMRSHGKNTTGISS
ncbi:CHAT domain-containing protein [Hyunsoonleella ulvae]|uniref:CHAT domain-containing protein n=1 Tax=Hyunsoonleella ulvae TaxID=2799948 RepID=UPI00193A2FA4|nr:CHAT domain-containing protein [Hyunsoonleella ulvae]